VQGLQPASREAKARERPTRMLLEERPLLEDAVEGPVRRTVRRLFMREQGEMGKERGGEVREDRAQSAAWLSLAGRFAWLLAGLQKNTNTSGVVDPSPTPTPAPPNKRPPHACKQNTHVSRAATAGQEVAGRGKRLLTNRQKRESHPESTGMEPSGCGGEGPQREAPAPQHTAVQSQTRERCRGKSVGVGGSKYVC
jgi:hypothetical protein